MERITIQPTDENLQWLREQKESNSKIINRLIDLEREDEMLNGKRTS